MRLRARLALAVVAAAAPLLAGIVWLRGDLARRDADRALREFALARMESGGRERCEADPAYFVLTNAGASERRTTGDVVDLGMQPGDVPAPAPPPPPEGGAAAQVPAWARGESMTQLWAYDARLTSRNPRAPDVPAEAAARVAAGATEAGAAFESGGVEGRQLLVRTPWPGGPCAFVLVRRVDAAPPDLAGFPVWSAVALVAVMAAGVAVAAGSVVRRVRRLTADVRRSAAERYTSPVEARGDDEIADLARAFDAAAGEIRGHIDEIARREDALRTFLANTTHDVMTPLTVLQGHVSAMRRCAAEGRPAELESANAAAEEAHHIASLVHNLAAVAKLDSGPRQVHLAPVNLNDLVQRVVERHWPLASPRAVEIAFAVPETPVWFDADVTLLEQAVGNVVGNAVRYHRAGGHVAVLLEELAGAEFTIRVVDDGPGVPDAKLASLGMRGFRTDDARSRHPEGTGLGLDIVRRVAEFHRLALSFRRSEHGGLEVEVRGRRGPAPDSARAARNG